jgi:large subunit ribosomal protein L20
VPRVKRGNTRTNARKKVLKKASGYFLTKSKLHRAAREAVNKAQEYAYVGRRLKKRDFRSLWITRINAGCRLNNISYSKFMGGMRKAEIDLNRKILADIAVNDPAGFTVLVDKARVALDNAA